MRTSTARKGRGGSFVFAAAQVSVDGGVFAFHGRFRRPAWCCHHRGQLFLFGGYVAVLNIAAQRDQIAEWLAQFLIGRVLAHNFEPLEESLVEQAAFLVVALRVGQIDVSREVERLVEGRQGVLERHLKFLDYALCCRPLALNALRLLLEERVADLVGVVGRQELGFLAFKLDQQITSALGLAVSLGANLIDIGVDRQSDPLPLLGRETDTRVAALDGVFDRADPMIRLRAEMLLATSADEIAVVVPAAITHARKEQSSAALAAVDAAAQIVVVAPIAFAALAPRIEQILNLPELRLVYERLMLSSDDLPVVADPADVVVVPQNLRQSIDGHRSWFVASSRARAKALRLQNARQLAQGVVARRVEVECPGDELSALIVDSNHSHFAPVDDFPRIEVADRCSEGRAAGFMLALQASLDLDGVAARAEGVDPGHDRVEQATCRRVVNSLKGRLQLAAVLLDLPQQPQRIEVVACDPREVVEDHVVELQIGKLGEHPLQRRSLRAGAALARLHVLGNNRSAELVRVALARLALRRDRIALGIAGLVHLTAARYPQVDRGAFVGSAHDAPPPMSPSSEIRCRIAEAGTP